MSPSLSSLPVSVQGPEGGFPPGLLSAVAGPDEGGHEGHRDLQPAAGRGGPVPSLRLRAHRPLLEVRHGGHQPDARHQLRGGSDHVTSPQLHFLFVSLPVYITSCCHHFLLPSFPVPFVIAFSELVESVSHRGTSCHQVRQTAAAWDPHATGR